MRLFPSLSLNSVQMSPPTLTFTCSISRPVEPPSSQSLALNPSIPAEPCSSSQPRPPSRGPPCRCYWLLEGTCLNRLAISHLAFPTHPITCLGETFDSGTNMWESSGL
ncbi:hypothetical protein H0G86_012360 [Trichoderma simmonsii]|uniref:Uncharacterized protein n=1 Tax=Trichoderma simmonsii TaxID=1491479 RepID=A0A8G0PL44_9HYPO|nr:hypothetical protein H0G86_012360 [Trichoderma simmonsii]